MAANSAGPTRERGVGADRAGEEVDLLALQIARDELVGLLRVATEVGAQELGRLAAELATELLDRQLEAIARLGAEGRERAGNVERDTDLDIGGMNGGGTAKRHGDGELLHRLHSGVSSLVIVRRTRLRATGRRNAGLQNPLILA